MQWRRHFLGPDGVIGVPADPGFVNATLEVGRHCCSMRHTRTWRWAVRLTRMYILLFVLGPFMWSGVAGRTCATWSQRDVAALDAPSTDLAVAAASMRHIEVPILPAGWTGFAVPGASLLASDGTADVVIHEAAHQLQMQQDGVVRYALRYGGEWVRGLYSGCGPFDAYRSVSYEIQARDVQNRVPGNAWGLADGTEDDAVAFAGALDAAGAERIVSAAEDARLDARAAGWFAVISRDAVLAARAERTELLDVKRSLAPGAPAR